MNQLEIEELLDKLSKQTEKDIEEVFNRRLRVILYQLSEMYVRYSNQKGELTWTDVNRYNRLQKELLMINRELNETYKEIVKVLQESTENIFIQGYLRNMYLYEMVTGEPMNVTIPTIKVIKQVLLNPIAELTLPKILEQHRNELVRKINIEISQSIIAGESYAVMAKRIENATKFSRNKARAVARTEGGRSRTIAGEKAGEQASKYVKLTGVWISALDLKVRHAHRVLDGKETDKEGYFHYKGWKAKAPHLWGIASMDINCRCVKLRKVNGMLPEYRRGRNYMDAKYQEKLAERINQYLPNMTYKQALKRAQKEVHPPNTTMPFTTFEEWYKKFAV